jgi:hypothetical protein
VIPYQPQLSLASDRTCGAAALAMAYQSLGISLPQETIWQAIGQRNQQGVRTARSYRLAGHAIQQGLAAVVVQAVQPWATLERCWAEDVRVIVNHRVRPDSRLGHYSVLAGIGPDEVLLHDPQLGPARRLTRESMLRLWLPTAGESEIVGNVLVAIGRRETHDRVCTACGAPIPGAVLCEGCGSPIDLDPTVALGCTTPGCPARLWEYLFCPQCDRCTGKLSPVPTNGLTHPPSSPG